MESEIYYCVRYSQSLVTTLSYTLSSYAFKINFNIILSSTPRSSKQSPNFSLFLSKPSTTLQANLWHSCPRALVGRFPWHAAFIVVPVVYFFPPTSVSTLWIMWVYIHVSECVEFEYELPLLPKSTACEKVLHRSGAVRNGAWIFII